MDERTRSWIVGVTTTVLATALAMVIMSHPLRSQRGRLLAVVGILLCGGIILYLYNLGYLTASEVLPVGYTLAGGMLAVGIKLIAQSVRGEAQ